MSGPPKPTFTISWGWRSRLPARNPPNPDYPYGMALDVSKGAADTCSVDLPYPAQGVGTHVVRCDLCGFVAVITAAGRADDPTKIKLPCKTVVWS